MKDARVSFSAKKAIRHVREALNISPEELAARLDIPVEQYEQLEAPQDKPVRISPIVLVRLDDMAREALGAEHETVAFFEAQFPLPVFRQLIAIQPKKEDTTLRAIKVKWEKGIALESPEWLLNALLTAAKTSMEECSWELHVSGAQNITSSYIVNHAHKALAEPSSYVETLFAKARVNTNGWFDDEKRDQFIVLMRTESQKLEQKEAMPKKWQNHPAKWRALLDSPAAASDTGWSSGK